MTHTPRFRFRLRPGPPERQIRCPAGSLREQIALRLFRGEGELENESASFRMTRNFSMVSTILPALRRTAARSSCPDRIAASSSFGFPFGILTSLPAAISAECKELFPQSVITTPLTPHSSRRMPSSKSTLSALSTPLIGLQLDITNNPGDSRSAISNPRR